MKALEIGEIHIGDDYHRRREESRRQAAVMRADLRVALTGLTVVFENRYTISLALHEALRAERITDSSRVAAELAAFNRLVPDEGQLIACLYLDAADQAELGGRLSESAGIERHVYLEVGVSRVPAEPEAVEPDAPSSAVSLLRFALSEGQYRDLVSGAELAVGVDHATLRERIPLTGAQRAAVAASLT